jgi:hypothetical protein
MDLYRYVADGARVKQIESVEEQILVPLTSLCLVGLTLGSFNDIFKMIILDQKHTCNLLVHSHAQTARFL